MTTHTTVRPQLAQPALIPGLDNIDWGQFHQVLGAPCQGCGHWHGGLLMGDGVGCCEHCGYAYAMTKPQPKPELEPEKRRPAVQRAAVIHDRCLTSRPRPREHRCAPCSRHGTGRDDGSGDDGDGDGSDPPPPSPARDVAGGAS